MEGLIFGILRYFQNKAKLQVCQVLNGHFNNKVDNNSRIFFRMANKWLAATTLMEMLAYNRGLITLQYYSFLQNFSGLSLLVV